MIIACDVTSCRGPRWSTSVVGESGGALQVVLRGVHDQVPFVVVLGRDAHGVEGNGNVLFAGTKKSTNADNERGHLAGLVDQNIHDLADLGVLRVIDALLVPIGHREGIGRNGVLRTALGEGSGADDGNNGASCKRIST